MSGVTVIQPEAKPQAIERFNITEAQLSQLNAECLTLSIKDTEDKDGYEKVRVAKGKLVSMRNQIDDRRLEIGREILKQKADVDQVAKRLALLITPAEVHLSAEKARIDKKLAEERLEREKKRNERFEKRIHEMLAAGCSFEDEHYVVGEVKITSDLAKSCSDADFKKFIKRADAEKWRLKNIQAQQQAEAARKTVVEAEVLPVADHVDPVMVIDEIPGAGPVVINDSVGIAEPAEIEFPQEPAQPVKEEAPVNHSGLSALGNSLKEYIKPAEETATVKTVVPLCEQQWYAVEYAGYYHINDEPYYESNDLLNEEAFPGKAAIHAELAASAPKMLKWLTILLDTQFDFTNVADTIHDAKLFIEKFDTV